MNTKSAVALRRKMVSLPGSLRPRERRGANKTTRRGDQKFARVAGRSWSGGSRSDDRLVAGQTKK